MHVGSKSIVFSFVFVTFALLISHTQAAHAQSMVVRMHGTGEARLADPSMGEPAGSFCFDVLLENVRTGENIEMGGTDCLVILPSEEGDGPGSVRVLGTTLLHFENGTLVAGGATTVQPVLHGSPGYTHITGAVPGADEMNVMSESGTGAYVGVTGRVRLAGAVDMSGFSPMLGAPITFDCLFVIDLDSTDNNNVVDCVEELLGLSCS